MYTKLSFELQSLLPSPVPSADHNVLAHQVHMTIYTVQCCVCVCACMRACIQIQCTCLFNYMSIYVCVVRVYTVCMCGEQSLYRCAIMCCADTLLFTDIMFAVTAVFWSCAAEVINDYNLCSMCWGRYGFPLGKQLIESLDTTY